MLPQADKIYILNASQENIDIIDNDKMVYIYKPYHGCFNKSILLNYVLNHYLQDYEYLFMSDVDLVYPNFYIKSLKSHIKDKPIRVIPRNIAMQIEYYSSHYNDLKIIADKFKQHITGEGHGIGLMHIPSLLKIQGWNEKFTGWGAEDQEVNLRLNKLGNQIIFDKSLCHIHLWHFPINREYQESNQKVFNESLLKIAK